MESKERDPKRQYRSNGAPVTVEGGARRYEDTNRTSAPGTASQTSRRVDTTTTTRRGGRGHNRWQDLPEFCDATAAVSAATYGSRRLPEIRALYGRRQQAGNNNTTDLLINDSSLAGGGIDPPPPGAGPSFGKADDALRSGGCKTSNRHLRRRATSHLRRKRHRFPSGNDGRGDSIAASSTEVSTTATGADASNTPSRRKRRKKRETLCQGRESWRDAPEATTKDTSRAVHQDNEEDADTSSNPNNHKAQWIPTHLWHAKRFHVETLFGWRVPVVHTNRGAKAALRLAQEGKTLVQDATYDYQPMMVRISSVPPAEATEKELQRILPGFRLNLQERRLVDGMLHHKDSFPLRAIGPVQWIVAPDAFLCFHESAAERDPSNPSSVVVYLFVNASVRHEALECLRRWASDMPKHMSASVLEQSVKGGMACLHLRGLNAMETLESAGSALGLDARHHSSATIIQSNHGRLLSFSFTSGPGSVAYGIIQCPRDPDLPCNRGTIGLDVWCHPDVASKLWSELIVRGGACPIGLVEQAHLAMEAEPPLPVFPRDYVDTTTGISYWSSRATLDCKLYRSCLEAGLGRISVSDNGPAKFVNWSSVVSSSHDATAVVRGEFGLPFAHCFPSTEPEPMTESSGRRHRRPQRPSDSMVHVPPLPRERLVEHQAMCQSLLDSLALPTLILCHILVSGKGTVAAGDTIFGFDTTAAGGRPVGRVTCGAFSPFRGAYHGLAVCGASRLLETIKSARSFVRTDHFPHRRHCLSVQVGNISPKFAGSLSLLF